MSDGVSVDKGSTVVSAGAVDVVMSYRNDIPGDAGLCIQIYAEVDGQDTELLRFDCFANAPHYLCGAIIPSDRDPTELARIGDTGSAPSRSDGCRSPGPRVAISYHLAAGRGVSHLSDGPRSAGRKSGGFPVDDGPVSSGVTRPVAAAAAAQPLAVSLLDELSDGIGNLGPLLC